ncbi:MAG: hypothetical protein L0Z53_19480 [Acidobacteriales bacterium]|nr:hypothetical protein [Terriglobales bacterium]
MNNDLITPLAWIAAAGFNIWLLHTWLRSWQRRRDARKAHRDYERMAAKRWGQHRR